MAEGLSILMSVYRNDKPDYLGKAVYSIYQHQSLKPNEIILIVDGPVSDELKQQIIKLENQIPCLRTNWLKENGGLGNALRIGVEMAQNDLIARMDSDDCSLPERFELQMDFIRKNPSIDILGGQINEFIDSENNVVGKRIVPTGHEELIGYTKKRCPFNHMTVMFRKESVLKVGNYIHWHYNEDYYLWIRMAEAGCKFANLPETLVNVRVGKDMYDRRGGWKYFKSEKGIQDYMLKHGIISIPRYCYNVAGRFAVQVAMPNKLRGFIFQKIFRK